MSGLTLLGWNLRWDRQPNPTFQHYTFYIPYIHRNRKRKGRWKVRGNASLFLRITISRLLDFSSFDFRGVQSEFRLLFWIFFLMGSSDRLFNRQRTVHQILGGGLGMINALFLWIYLITSIMGFHFQNPRT